MKGGHFEAIVHFQIDDSINRDNFVEVLSNLVKLRTWVSICLNLIPPKTSRRVAAVESSTVKLKCRAGAKTWKTLLSMRLTLVTATRSLESLTAMGVLVILFRS